MAPKTKTCVSCSESVPRGTPVGNKEYPDAIHYFDADSNFLYADRTAETSNYDSTPAYGTGLHCKACNADAGRIWRRDPTYIRDLREANA